MPLTSLAEQHSDSVHKKLDEKCYMNSTEAPLNANLGLLKIACDKFNTSDAAVASVLFERSHLKCLNRCSVYVLESTCTMQA